MELKDTSLLQAYIQEHVPTPWNQGNITQGTYEVRAQRLGIAVHLHINEDGTTLTIHGGNYSLAETIVVLAFYHEALDAAARIQAFVDRYKHNA